MHVRRWGPEGGRPVVLLHALGCHGGWWDWVGPALGERGFRVVVPDFRGHGDSPWADAYRFEDYAADVEGLVAQLGWESYALVGHSMGGYVGLTVAARSVRPPAAVVVADMKTGSTAEELAALKVASAKPGRTYASLDEAVARYRLAPPEHKMPPERLAAVAAACYRSAGGVWVEKFDRKALAIEPVTPEALVPQVRCPALFVRGEHSPVMPEEGARALARTRGADLVEMPGLHHHLPLEAPEAFADLVSAFLDA
jgi:pimeloyl-ACP methyl ester carboxylesterase